MSLIIIALWIVRFMDNLFGVYKSKNEDHESSTVMENEINIK